VVSRNTSSLPSPVCREFQRAAVLRDDSHDILWCSSLDSCFDFQSDFYVGPHQPGEMSDHPVGNTTRVSAHTSWIEANAAVKPLRRGMRHRGFQEADRRREFGNRDRCRSNGRRRPRDGASLTAGHSRRSAAQVLVGIHGDVSSIEQSRFGQMRDRTALRSPRGRHLGRMPDGAAP